MKFRVVWLESGLEQFGRAYATLAATGGSDEAITRAMTRIGSLLERDPHHQGESRSPGERIMTEAPLTVRYEVHDDEKLVIIFTVVYRPRKG